MNILLDTHIAIWALSDDERLETKARQLILDPDNFLYFSAISVMEISIKHHKDPENMEWSGSAFYEECLKAGFYTMPFKPKHATLLDDLISKYHKDPFDRALIAQARSENMYLMTHDEMLKNYNESCVLFV